MEPSRRYIITIDRALLEGQRAGDPAAKPILVEDTDTGIIERHAGAELAGAKIVYGGPLRNGARVWIEADSVVSD